MIADRGCSVTGCDSKHRARGLCNAHYQRLLRHGDALAPRFSGSPADRFWRKVNKTSSCWLWTGCGNPNGYGTFAVNRRMTYAHRFAYELLVGPIPPLVEIDHTCHNGSGCAGGPSCPHRRCVNPSHLEAVIHVENVRRGTSLVPLQVLRTHCKWGHEFTPENTRQDGNTRICRTCKRGRSRAQYQERRAIAAGLKVVPVDD